MKKHLLMVTALLMTLTACSQSSDKSSPDFSSNGMRAKIEGSNTSQKLATRQELADMEEMSSVAQFLSGDLNFNLPDRFERIGNLTVERSELSFKADLQDGLFACSMNVHTEPSRTRYWFHDDDNCDFTMSGGEQDGEVRGIYYLGRELNKSFTLTKKEAAENTVASVSIRVRSTRESRGLDEVGQTRTRLSTMELELTVTLVDGKVYQLMAMSSDRSRSAKIADNRSNNETVDEFLAAVVLPESSMNYHWQKTTGTDYPNPEEFLKINGAFVVDQDDLAAADEGIISPEGTPEPSREDIAFEAYQRLINTPEGQAAADRIGRGRLSQMPFVERLEALMAEMEAGEQEAPEAGDADGQPGDDQ